MRFGKKYGFNFNKFKDEKIGILRQFVKKHKHNNDDESMTNNAKKGDLEKIKDYARKLDDSYVSDKKIRG